MLHKFCESASLCNDIIALSYLKFAGSSKESEKGKKRGGGGTLDYSSCFSFEKLKFLYREERERMINKVATYIHTYIRTYIQTTYI